MNSNISDFFAWNTCVVGFFSCTTSDGVWNSRTVLSHRRRAGKCRGAIKSSGETVSATSSVQHNLKVGSEHDTNSRKTTARPRTAVRRRSTTCTVKLHLLRQLSDRRRLLACVRRLTMCTAELHMETAVTGDLEAKWCNPVGNLTKLALA